MIVVDTNLVVYLFVAGEKTSLSRQVYARDPDWVVPSLWKHEFLNVLATSVRQEVLTLEQALLVWQYGQDFLHRRERRVNMASALNWAVEQRVSAYDAQFIVLARELECKLITEDRRLRAKSRGQALSMQQFLEEPRA